MRPDEAKAALGRLIAQGKYLCDITQIAKRGRQSVRGNGTYGRKFHAGVVAISGTLARLQPTLDTLNLDGMAKACERVRQSCAVLTNPDTDQKGREAALKVAEMAFHATLEPALDQIIAPAIPATEQVLPGAVVKQTRGYLEKIVLQANGCYERGWFDPCSVMIRKLVEVLIIAVYEAEKRAAEVKRNKNPANDFLMLADLIDIISLDTSINLARETKRALPGLKSLGDRSAHNRHYLATKDDVDTVTPGLRVVVDDLLHLAKFK